MARLSRLTLSGLPHYVVQRGNNLQPIVHDAQDYLSFQDILRETARGHQIDIHAWVLLPNQFHLLVTPAQADSLPRFMQALGRTYVRRFNNRHGRTGTLWEGRYRTTLLEPEAWLLPAMLVLESAPVREGLVPRAVDYVHSSARHNVGAITGGILRPHRAYWALGDTPFAREAAYATRLEVGVTEEQVEVVLHAALKGWVLGSDTFIHGLQQHTQRRLSRQKVGRPAGKRVVEYASA